MRPRKPEAEKKKPGPKPHRLFYNRIGFHLDNDIHQKMREIAANRKILPEEVYREALALFLDMRSTLDQQLDYYSAPSRTLAKRVTIEMEEALCQAIRHAAVDDRRRLSDLFETAVRLYLAGQPPKKQ